MACDGCGADSPWNASHSLPDMLYVCILKALSSSNFDFPGAWVIPASCTWLPKLKPEKYRLAMASLCPAKDAFLDNRSTAVLRLGSPGRLPLRAGPSSSIASVASEDVSIRPKQGDMHRRSRGAMGGRFVVMSATKVSRMAHMPLLLCFGSCRWRRQPCQVWVSEPVCWNLEVLWTYFEHQNSPREGNSGD